jgi:low affinity Fe/Cu permease
VNKKTQVEAPSRATRFFGDLAKRTSYEAGRAPAFLLAAAVVVIWALSGPLFNFSDTWELIINTGTTIVTFLMVFLIQNSQNRDSAAIQVKLDELIRVGAARNSLVGIEHLTVHEIEEIRKKKLRIRCARGESRRRNTRSEPQVGASRC